MQETHTSSTHSRLRPPRDLNRRSSQNSDEDRRSNPSTAPGDSDRERYWNTILGHSPHSTDAQQSMTYSYSTVPRQPSSRRMNGPLRSNHSRQSSMSSPPRTFPHHPSRTSIDFPTSSPLPRNTPNKPFACTQCPRRFERKGHLKVSDELICPVFKVILQLYSACAGSLLNTYFVNKSKTLSNIEIVSLRVIC